jgi:hypothetical protein
MDPFPIREGVCPWPITLISSPPRWRILTLLSVLPRLPVRPWEVALVAAGVVTCHGVSRDVKLNRLCRILRRLHHIQNRPVVTIRLIQRRR